MLGSSGFRICLASVFASASRENEMGAMSESGHTYSVLPASSGSSVMGMPQLMSRVMGRYAHSSTSSLLIPFCSRASRPVARSALLLNWSRTFFPGVYLRLCFGSVAASSL